MTRSGSRVGEAGIGSDLSIGSKGARDAEEKYVEVFGETIAGASATVQQGDVSEDESSVPAVSSAKDKALAMLRKMRGKH